MKKSAAAHLKMLSEMSADPTKAARAMLDTWKKHFKQTNKQVSFITLERLTRKQLGTEEVEARSRSLFTNRGGIHRDQGYINYVMKRRLEDARSTLKKAKAEYRNSINYLATQIREDVMREFCRFMKQEVEKEWRIKIMRMKRKQKIQALENKYKPWTKPVEPRINDIKISDFELEHLESQEAEASVPVYGGVEVSDDLKKALSLPPKFALHPKVGIKSVETEIEKGIYKARWSHMLEMEREGREPTEQEVEQELASNRVWDKETKELDFTRHLENMVQYQYNWGPFSPP